MMASQDATLAAIAAKSEKESAYHLRHSAEWVIRLGDGTEESHRRAQAAIDDLWAFTGELFHTDAADAELIAAGVAIDPASLRAGWLATLSEVMTRATLTLPNSDWMQKGGRSGVHTEHLGFLLADLQFMQRSYPGATW
jgi:ring-1,2-phenylacetyl-CoA epoxidase subunit PaaC